MPIDEPRLVSMWNKEVTMSKKRTMRRVSSIHAPVMLFLLAVSLLAGCGAEGDGILDQKAETEGITVPVLISPADGSSFMDTTPDFDWNDVSGATGYRVQISTVNDFSATVTDQQTPSSSFSFSGRALSPGNYYWRVMAHNGASGASEWSDAFTFSVARSGTAIIPPVLQSPANGGITEDTTPDFEWEDAAGATGYQLQAAGSPEFISPSVDVMMSASNYAFSATPLGLGTYYWRVRAQSGPEKWSEWSSPFSFTIVSTSVDTQPQAVILQPSGDRTIFVGGSVDFAGAVTGGDGQITYTWDFGDARTSDVLDPPPITFGTPGRYTIQFNAVDTDGDQSTSRIIITATDDAPVLMEPDNGYASTSGTIAFSWGMVDAAASYILSLESNGSPSSYTATAAAYTVTGLSSGDYTWSVCAVDSLGNRGGSLHNVPLRSHLHPLRHGTGSGQGIVIPSASGNPTGACGPGAAVPSAGSEPGQELNTAPFPYESVIPEPDGNTYVQMITCPLPSRRTDRSGPGAKICTGHSDSAMDTWIRCNAYRSGLNIHQRTG